MRIEPNSKPVELSYIDLLNGLKTDLDSDNLPSDIKSKAAKHIEELQRLLEGFSA